MRPDSSGSSASWLDIHSEAGRQLWKQIEDLRTQAPSLYSCIDLSRISYEACPPSIIDSITNVVDFESASQGGRGESYRHAQRDPMIRSVGIRQLFELVSPGRDLTNLSSDYKILDVLGGDGTLTRALLHFLPSTARPEILTSDLSSDMVAAARAYHLPALRQPAQYLLLKENCMDAVIIAYGSHHISPRFRLQVCKEAYRVLKPGGRIVLHDFEEHSPTARWFSEVVDRYSLVGHHFSHFTPREIHTYLAEAGFQEIEVVHMYDPFILSGESPLHVQRKLGECLLAMYALNKLADEHDPQSLWKVVYELAAEYFHYDYSEMNLDANFGAPCIQMRVENSTWHIEMPRVALVGSATK